MGQRPWKTRRSVKWGWFNELSEGIKMPSHLIPRKGMTSRHAVPAPDAGGSMSFEIPGGGSLSRAPEQPGGAALRVFRVIGVWRGWIRSGFLRLLFLVLW